MVSEGRCLTEAQRPSVWFNGVRTTLITHQPKGFRLKTSEHHRPWINFKELRTRLRFDDILRHYKVEIQKDGAQHKGPCPFPGHTKSRNAPTFSANLERGIFRCFSCGAQGNLLEFAALMEGVDPKDGQALRTVAVKLQETFVPEGASRKTRPAAEELASPVLVNAPIDFSLKGLDPAHPFFAEHGISEETAVHFGAGYCARGAFAGRIAIPLHDAEGRLVGYAGHAVDAAESPQIVFPSRREREGKTLDFDPSALLYNAHRLPEQTDTLTVFDDILAVWGSHQKGSEPAVALLGGRCSSKQMMLISSVLEPTGTLQIVTGDERLVKEFLPVAAKHFATRWLPIVAKRGGVG